MTLIKLKGLIAIIAGLGLVFVVGVSLNLRAADLRLKHMKRNQGSPALQTPLFVAGNQIRLDDQAIPAGPSNQGGSRGESGHQLAIGTTPLLTPVIKLTASDAIPNSLFGAALAIEGGTAVIGAYLDGTNGSASGAVYIFTGDEAGWTQQTKLEPGDSLAGALFGRSVAISGKTVVIGAPGNGPAGLRRAGAAYVFVQGETGWTQQAKLTARNPRDNELLGTSVAIDGEAIIIGAPGESQDSAQSGVAYVFIRLGTRWIQVARLTSSDSSPGDFFGKSVAIKGNKVVVGAPGQDETGTGSGAAYVFGPTETTWSQVVKLIGDDTAPGDDFGAAVAMSGDTIAIGAPENDAAGQEAGALYLFKEIEGINGSWTQQAKLTADDGQPGDEFGSAVSIYSHTLYSHTLVIGAPGGDVDYEDAGAAYLFKYDASNWIQIGKLIADDGDQDDFAGFAVAINEELTLVSAHLDDDNGTKSGAAYIYDINSLLSPQVHLIHLPLVMADQIDDSGPTFVDLLVSHVDISPPMPQVGQATVISVTVRNAGTGPVSAPFWVDLYLATEPISPVTNQIWDDSFTDSLVPHGVAWRVYTVADNDTIQLTNLNPNDLAGTCDNFSNFIPNNIGCWPQTWKGMPLNNHFSIPGAYYLYVQVDSLDDQSVNPSPLGLIRESNEDNNLFGPILITVQDTLSTTRLPDLNRQNQQLDIPNPIQGRRSPAPP